MGRARRPFLTDRQARTVLAVIAAAALVVLVAGCGYDGGYRYPCQDPDNWHTADCQSPRCDVWGTCPKDLVPSCGALVGRDCKGM